jgi:hypothetical protein
VQEIAVRNTIDVGQAAVRIPLKIKTGQEVEQTLMSAVGDRHRQGFFVERLDIAADETSQQPIQSPLVGLVPAQIFKFLLKDLEGPQPVVLLREPGVQLIHVSLFKIQKKLWIYTVGQVIAQMANLHPYAASRAEFPTS